MHCTSQSLLRGAFNTALRHPTNSPPGFLLPFAARQSTPFSTTAPLEKRRKPGPDRNPARGQSALKRTGLKNQRLGSIQRQVDAKGLPKPVLDPKRRSEVNTDPEHGLWGFFTEDGEVLQPPIAVVAHGRAWSVPELRIRDWDDLHRLWWVCVKEVNRISTMEAERQRVQAGHGEYEAQERTKVVRQTMKRIEFVLTERWYAWEDARWNAMSDPSVDMYAEDGQNAYEESKDVDEEADAFEKAEQASNTTSAESGRYIPPGPTSPSTGQDARV